MRRCTSASALCVCRAPGRASVARPPLLIDGRDGLRSRIRLETVGDCVVVARIGNIDMRDRAQTGWRIERAGGNRDVVAAYVP